jgi:hypothetical protein
LAVRIYSCSARFINTRVKLANTFSKLANEVGEPPLTDAFEAEVPE